MTQQACTGRESATLEEIVQNQDDTKNHHHHIGKLRATCFACQQGAYVCSKSKSIVGDCTQQKTDGHVITGICAVSKVSVQKAAKSIHNGYQRHDDAETGLSDTIFCTKSRNGE